MSLQTLDNSALNALGQAMVDASGGRASGYQVAFEELCLFTSADKVVELLRILRDDPNFRVVQLTDLTCVDWPSKEARFEMVYQLISYVKNVRVRVKLSVAEDEPVPSICEVHPCADWFERETFDMFGVFFSGHPDLRRILTDYGFHGHPLRKDFPMTGYVEVRWDDALKRVVYEPVKLVQEFRAFDFMSPWEGASYVLPGDEKARG
jgi:NADH-quinone oxidoreductase subunit C